MDWLNLHIPSALRSPEFLGSSPTERGVWLCVLAYAATIECGGRIPGAATWKDRQWQQSCGVTLREVRAASKLLHFDADGVVVVFYPADKEAEVKEKREIARRNGRLGGRPQKTNTETNVGTDKKPALVISPKAEGEGEGEGKEKNPPPPPAGGQAAPAADSQADGKARKQSTELPAIPTELDTPEFRTAWSDWLAYRRERRLSAYKPIGMRQAFAQLVGFGSVGIAIESIRQSIGNNWQGLFAPRAVSGQQPQTRLSTDAGIDELKRRHGGTF